MNSNPAALSDTSAAFCALLTLLVPLAAAGIALINAGLGRTRSVAQSLFTSLCSLALAAVLYFVCGFAWQGGPLSPGKAILLAGKQWDWIGGGSLFLRGVNLNNSPLALVALFGMLSVGLASLIPLGAGIERWRIAAALSSTALLAGWTFPLFAHWVWGSGWLKALGPNYSLGYGFIDNAGAGCIHAVGGLTALAIVWFLGPRRGKYNTHGMPAAIPGHNAPFVLFGCVLALVGWFGLNSAGAMLFAGAGRAQMGPAQIPSIAINTLLCACGATISAASNTRVRFGKPDASLCANGFISGLVASSAGCALFNPAESLLIGLIAGTLVLVTVEILELRLKVDDPTGAVAVHAVGGIWGLLAVGFFTNTRQLTAQLVGIATLIGFVFPMTYLLNWLLSRVVPFRAAPEGDRQGLDLFELGAGAYPEFMIHRDDTKLG